MPQQKALQRDSNSSNGQSRLCGVKIMSFPNGELCVKRTGVGGKGTDREPHRGGLQLVFVPSVLGTAYVCLCVARRRARERETVSVCVREHTFINTKRLQACRHGDKRKNKIKATNMHPLPLLGLVFTGRSTRQLACFAGS